ncbi:MAG: glutamate-1-semialdehyde 2,1-aminomutase [Bacteroidota bacterium]
MTTSTDVRPALGLDRAALEARFAKSIALAERSHALIPGGAHTYAKGDDQLPAWAPVRVVRGDGCTVWDADGHAYVEYGMGLRAVTLGHGYAPVVQAATRAMQGTNFTRPAAIEVEAAEALLDLVPGAEMVKFAKDGSTVTTAAIKLARAVTGRTKVAVCQQNPFLSYNDWFIGRTPMDAGIPQQAVADTVAFEYNDFESVLKLFDDHAGEIACVIMEASRGSDPEEGFLHRVQWLCHQRGALFILDEMITGFRWHTGGAQALYGITPDLACFGKALANGFSVSALTGRRDIMELGGLRTDQDRVFLLSATHGAETHGLAAAIATMQVYRKHDICGFMHRQGEKLRARLSAAITVAGVEGYVEVLGRSSNLVFATRDRAGRPSQAFRTLLLQELVLRGILAPSLVLSFAHDDDALDQTVAAFAEALHVYARALEDGGPDGGPGRWLIGRPVQPVFRKRA